MKWRAQGFTLVEVLVALMVVAIGLAAMMTAVSSTARTSGYLRDKTLSQWIALNRLTEVRLNSNNKFAQNTDTGEVKFAGRTWHYDTRYFDTSIATMKRVVVRVYAGDAKTKGNPVAETTTFLGTAVAAPGSSNTVDWTVGSTAGTSTGIGGAGSAATGAGVAVAPTGASGTGTTTPNATTTTTPGTTPPSGNTTP